MSRGLRPRGAPESPKSAPRSPKRVQKRSFGLFLDSFRTPGRTLWGLWGSPGPEAPGHPFGLFSDSFGVPGPKGPGALCARRGGFLTIGNEFLTIGNEIVTVHKLFWGSSLWITVAVLAVPRMNQCYSYSTKWKSQRTDKSPQPITATALISGQKAFSRGGWGCIF